MYPEYSEPSGPAPSILTNCGKGKVKSVTSSEAKKAELVLITLLPAVVFPSVALFFPAKTLAKRVPCAVVTFANILPPPWSVITPVLAVYEAFGDLNI